MTWRPFDCVLLSLACTAAYAQTDTGNWVTFRFIVKLPPTYSYYATPGVKYRTVQKEDAEGRAYTSGTEDPQEGDWYAFTPDGDTAVHERWSADRAYKFPDQSDSTSILVQRTVFWQPVPGTTDEFLFVSKAGFVTFNNGSMVQYDHAPDNLIDDWTDEATCGPVSWIWKNGKREPFRYKQHPRAQARPRSTPARDH
jgi:hypothetical protein